MLDKAPPSKELPQSPPAHLALERGLKMGVLCSSPGKVPEKPCQVIPELCLAVLGALPSFFWHLQEGNLINFLASFL